MNSIIPTIIVGPCVVFREGLRHILSNADFYAIWCSEIPPSGPIFGISDEINPLFITSYSIEDSIIHVSNLKQYYPDIKSVVLTPVISEKWFIKALQAEINILIHEQSSCENLIYALKLIINDVSIFPSDMINSILSTSHSNNVQFLFDSNRKNNVNYAQIMHSSQLSQLSVRELDVLSQLIVGLSNKEIARKLDITEATVKVHVKAIFRKTGARSRTQIVMWAARQDIGNQIDMPVSQFDLNNRSN